jgi:hypothetical protein
MIRTANNSCRYQKTPQSIRRKKQNNHKIDGLVTYCYENNINNDKYEKENQYNNKDKDT